MVLVRPRNNKGVRMHEVIRFRSSVVWVFFAPSAARSHSSQTVTSRARSQLETPSKPSKLSSRRYRLDSARTSPLLVRGAKWPKVPRYSSTDMWDIVFFQSVFYFALIIATAGLRSYWMITALGLGSS